VPEPLRPRREPSPEPTPPRLRVLDLTDPLGHNAARLLVGLGADVLRLAAPLGFRAADLHWHAGKRLLAGAGVTERREQVARLLGGADVVLESGPREALLTLEMRERDPRAWEHVVHVVVTPFGLTGPRRDWLADDLVAAAAGGMAWLGGAAGGPPQAPPRSQATQLAGAHAAVAALLGVRARQRTGTGQLAEVSVQEAVAATLETGAIAWIHGAPLPGRTSGVYAHVAHRVFEASDGHVAGGYSGSGRMWTDLLAWLAAEGAAEDLADERWQDPTTRWQQRTHVDEVVARFVRRHGAAEFADAARERALPWAQVVGPGQLVANPQLQDRRFFVELQDGGRGAVDVGFPFEDEQLPRPVRLAAPEQVPGSPGWRPRPPGTSAPRLRPPRDDRPGALSGLRVLDLTWVLAGPYATKVLGEHGADVVKVESRHREDPTRFAPSMRLRPGASHDESGYFINVNRNKRSLALNLRTSQGVALLHRLVAACDVVVENFSPGVLDRWGLSYERMVELNPDVVLVSMAGVGQTGPWRRAVTFADTLAAMSGLTSETGDGDGPHGLTFGLGDMVAANAAVLAVLDRVVSGRGGHVDLSQLEAMAAHLGPALLEAQLGAPEPPAEEGFPGVYRTLGDDRWLAVGFLDPSGRAALRTACGAGAGQSTADALRQWCATLDGEELAQQLQELGVPSYQVQDGRDLVERDPQLARRGFYVELAHPLVGPVAHEGIVVRLDETPGRLHTPAPLLGQHSDELLTELLGLGGDELARLHHDGALE